MSLTRKNHQWIVEHQPQPTVAIDATCGNGNDTAFLARHAQQVIGFDVQQAALESTQERLDSLNIAQPVTLVQQGHETMTETLHKLQINEIDICMFNLGYLPHSDKTLTTQPDTTIAAINQAFDSLSQGGVITLLCYRGHPGGADETDRVVKWCTKKQESKQLSIDRFDSTSPSEISPILLCVKKL